MHFDRLLQNKKIIQLEAKSGGTFLHCIFSIATNLKYLHNQQKMFVQDGHVQDMRKRFLSLYLKTSLIRVGHLLKKRIQRGIAKMT